MSGTTFSCPKCKDGELEFEVEQESADDGIWFSAGFVKKDCECEFSDAQMTVLEGDASFQYAEANYHYEP